MCHKLSAIMLYKGAANGEIGREPPSSSSKRTVNLPIFYIPIFKMCLVKMKQPSSPVMNVLQIIINYYRHNNPTFFVEGYFKLCQ